MIITTAMVTALLATDPAKVVFKRSNPLTCMAVAMYYEGRDQPYLGQRAIAHVIQNRYKEKRFGKSICRVVYKKYAFSFTLEKTLWKSKFDKDEWEQIVPIAQKVLTGKYKDITNGSLYYCNDKTASASWCKISKATVRIKDHKFVLEKDIIAASLK